MAYIRTMTAAEMLSKLQAVTDVFAGVDVATRMSVEEMVAYCRSAISCVEVGGRWNVTTVVDGETLVVGVEDMGDDGVAFHGVLQEVK
jgi:hypothetical protein